MPLILMHRDGDVAEVNTDIVATYQNFLAHGWVEKPAEAPETPPIEAPAPSAEAPKPEQAEPASRQGRKAGK
jgi:hypothetical protein